MNYFKIFPIGIAVALLSLAGCHGDDRDTVPEFTTQIFSDPGLDGDIERTEANDFFVTQGMSSTVQSVFAGIDSVSASEFKTFLNFHLDGSGGVPGDAIIDNAFLDIFIDRLQPAGSSLRLLIELVSFQPPTLFESDFDQTVQPPLASIRITTPITDADVGTSVSVDVTALMVEAQNRGLNDFQLRISEDPGSPAPVLIEIDDTTASDRKSFAPLLTVTYF